MKERPILFSGPMVRAILEGRKTMTRRVVNFKNIARQAGCTKGSLSWFPSFNSFGVHGGNVATHIALVECPYGRVGDRLWVRESYAPFYFDYCKHGYKADWDGKAADLIPEPKWKPSIHMPRSASRILLELTAVRVERLQEISEEDAKAEGVDAKRWGDLRQCPMSLLGGIGSSLPAEPQHRFGFYELWNSINARRGYGWDSNPWVWVIEFKRLSGARP